MSEVQPWWRRGFDYTTPPEIERAKSASDVRLAFWRSVLDELSPKTHFVFVSQCFSDEVMEDLEREIPPDQVHVVHNPVNTTIFDYVPKSAEQRLKILSIRPYAVGESTRMTFRWRRCSISPRRNGSTGSIPLRG